jgi:predicted RNA-binding Zn-ribbon protein involved in translation (DUF1610 family)
VIQLGVDRTVSSAASPISGGVASPAASASFPRRDETACRRAGGAVGAERPGGPRTHERVVRAGECQCCGQLVPAAHRHSRCPLCGSPVIRRLNENAPLAQDTLDRAFLGSGIQHVEAACPGCGDDLDGAMLLIREVEDGEIVDTVVADRGGYGDGPTVLDCDSCGGEILPDTVVLRDRQRSAQEITDLSAVA